MSPVQLPSDLFRSQVEPGVAARVEDEAAHIDEVLAELYESGREAWPTVLVTLEAFVPYLARRLPPTATSVDALKQLRVGDLYLACACANGDAAAMAVFDTAFLANIGWALPPRPDVTQSEVKQAVREKLLLAREGAPPKIADYSGRGDLASWVRVVAVRTALNLGRGRNREVPLGEDELLADKAGVGPDAAEMRHLKKLYRGEFADAFRRALQALNVRDRNMLRQHYVDGVPMARIGAIYNVHRITVVRRMREAKKQLAAETRRLLKAKLHVSRGELQSIMRLIQSHFDVSLRSYLRDGDGGPTDP